VSLIALTGGVALMPPGLLAAAPHAIGAGRDRP